MFKTGSLLQLWGLSDSTEIFFRVITPPQCGTENKDDAIKKASPKAGCYTSKCHDCLIRKEKQELFESFNLPKQSCTCLLEIWSLPHREIEGILLQISFCVTCLKGNNQPMSSLIPISTWSKKFFPPWAQSVLNNNFHSTLHRSTFHQTATRDKSPRKSLFLYLYIVLLRLFG